MQTERPIESAVIPPETLAALQSLYDEGLMLQAYQAAQSLPHLSKWAGPGARTLAARLAGNLGAPRLGQVLHWQAWRAAAARMGLSTLGLVLLPRRRR